MWQNQRKKILTVSSPSKTGVTPSVGQNLQKSWPSRDDHDLDIVIGASQVDEQDTTCFIPSEVAIEMNRLWRDISERNLMEREGSLRPAVPFEDSGVDAGNTALGQAAQLRITALERENRRLELDLAQLERDYAVVRAASEERKRYITVIRESYGWKFLQILRALAGRRWS